jgi:hypothetical protein
MFRFLRSPKSSGKALRQQAAENRSRLPRRLQVESLEDRCVPSVDLGPFVYNGHTYYRLEPSTWTAAESEAIGLGGHLVTLNDLAEHNWVFDTFSRQGQYALWIGLNDVAVEGSFVWSSGEPVTFTQWAIDQPDNFNGEAYGCLMVAENGRTTFRTRKWNDFQDFVFENITSGGVLQGVVEVPTALDITPTSLAWNTGEGGVDFGYSVTGADLTRDTTAALYWASGPTFADRIGGPVYDTQIEHPQGEYGPFYVPNGVLGAPPVGAIHLLLVVDPTSAAQPHGAIDESDETNNLAAIALPNVHVTGVNTDDSRSVKVSYTVEGAGIDPIPVKVFRSADETPSSDDVVVALADTTVPGSLGDHTGANAVTLQLSDPLQIDPSRPYVLVVADSDETILEANEADNDAHFRKRVLGVVTNGLQLLGPIPSILPGFWIRQMASALENTAGYDRAFPYDWASLSNIPLPLIAQQEAGFLAIRVANEVRRLKTAFPDDIVDVHLIGHSRGAVVNTVAATFLQANPEVTRGTLKLTLLDPHPARNYPGTEYFDYSRNLLGGVVRQLVIAFQALARDPSILIPANVDLAENFFQHTPVQMAPPGWERILNLWGSVPIATQAARYAAYDLTRPGMSHTRVVDWYAANILGTLDTGGEFNTSSATASGAGGQKVARHASNSALPTGGTLGRAVVEEQWHQPIFFAPDWISSGSLSLPAGAISDRDGDGTLRVTSHNAGMRFDVSGDNGKDRIELSGTWGWARV